MADGQSTGDTTPRPLESDPNDPNKSKDKSKIRNLFGLVKKKEDSKTTATNSQAPSVPKETSQLSSVTNRSATSPHPPASPNRVSESSRLASPARSQIFERDVQDSTVLQPSSPAIPTHIQTENHIPPVLDDASEAITNSKLDPDSVEIVTHSSHQPAAVTVTGATSPPVVGTPAEQQQFNPDWTEELNTFANRGSAIAPDNASNYGSLDSADVRRLSFISFADVVQSEHTSGPGASGSRDSIHMAGLTSLPPAGMNRSPSPIRSPVSSPGVTIGTSPPTSNPASIKGLEMSPARKPLGSPGSGSNLMPTSGDLNIETMSQALRRTTSSDLSNVRSIPTSPTDGSGPKELPVVK